jgi:hypothetical protein
MLVDTYRIVRSLEKTGLSRRQSVAIMLVMDNILKSHIDHLNSSTLKRSELENLNYSYRSALSKQKDELSSLRLKESAVLKSENEFLIKEIERLTSKFNEFNSSLKSEINLDLNNHKSDNRELGTDIHLATSQVIHKLLVKISVLKMNMETVKVNLTRDIVWYSFGFFLGILTLDFFIPKVPQRPLKIKNERSDQ